MFAGAWSGELMAVWYYSSSRKNLCSTNQSCRYLTKNPTAQLPASIHLGALCNQNGPTSLHDCVSSLAAAQGVKRLAADNREPAIISWNLKLQELPSIILNILNKIKHIARCELPTTETFKTLPFPIANAHLCIDHSNHFSTRRHHLTNLSYDTRSCNWTTTNIFLGLFAKSSFISLYKYTQTINFISIQDPVTWPQNSIKVRSRTSAVMRRILYSHSKVFFNFISIMSFFSKPPTWFIFCAINSRIFHFFNFHKFWKNSKFHHFFVEPTTGSKLTFDW